MRSIPARFALLIRHIIPEAASLLQSRASGAAYRKAMVIAG
jgi:hypothetical protein